jgi:membrane protein DedA with SNARE-associated domain
MINLFALITVHTQLLIGLVQYFFTSSKTNFSSGWMKVELYRFYGMEHLVGMLIAIVLITVGYSKSKKAATDAEKFKKIKVFYLVGLILILASIPWPFRTALGGSWF